MKRSIAYYHLPGLFEFYELYKVFLPLFQEHREYFYDWCDIGSVYGAPADCIWGGVVGAGILEIPSEEVAEESGGGDLNKKRKRERFLAIRTDSRKRSLLDL